MCTATLQLHTLCNWCLCCCCPAEDEKIINVTEVLHNLPLVPRLLRAIWTTLITTAGLAVSGW